MRQIEDAKNKNRSEHNIKQQQEILGIAAHNHAQSYIHMHAQNVQQTSNTRSFVVRRRPRRS